MKNKRLVKWIFPLIALGLLLPWPIAFAADISGDEETIRIEIAEESVKPNVTVFGKAISSINPGDLFHIDASNNAQDIMVILSITNPQELISHYTYMILNVGVYVEENGEWVKASGSDGNLNENILLSMRNGQVSFLLPGYAKYKISIDSGALRCHNAGGDTGSLSPQFHLEVN